MTSIIAQRCDVVLYDFPKQEDFATEHAYMMECKEYLETYEHVIRGALKYVIDTHHGTREIVNEPSY